MPDLLRKQLIAVVDDRTTLVCLHAAGQVRDLAEPFDTLSGPHQAPPFHRGCRSHVAAWMVGYGRRLRDRANAEILRRPPAEKRISAAGYEGRLPGAVRPIDYTPEQLRAVIRRGLPDVNTALADVPRDRVRDWMVAHPGRFRVTAIGGRVGNVLDVLDRRTGDRFTIRTYSTQVSAVADVAGAALHSAAGLPAVDTVASQAAVVARSVIDSGWTVAGVGVPTVTAQVAADAARLLAAGYLLDDTGLVGLGVVHLTRDSTTRLHAPTTARTGLARYDQGTPGDWTTVGRSRVSPAAYLAGLGVSTQLVDAARQSSRADVDAAVAAVLSVPLSRLLRDTGGLDTGDWATVYRARRPQLRADVLARALGVR